MMILTYSRTLWKDYLPQSPHHITWKRKEGRKVDDEGDKIMGLQFSRVKLLQGMFFTWFLIVTFKIEKREEFVFTPTCKVKHWYPLKCIEIGVDLETKTRDYRTCKDNLDKHQRTGCCSKHI